MSTFQQKKLQGILKVKSTVEVTKLESDTAGMLQLSEQKYFYSRINMLKTLMEKK